MADQGFRALPHTADMRIEAWAPTRAGCLRQIVLGAVASFARTDRAPTSGTARARLDAAGEEVVAQILDEVIFLTETAGTPVDVEVREDGDALEATFWLTDRATLAGAVPKAVSRGDLWLAHDGDRWVARATIDI